MTKSADQLWTRYRFVVSALMILPPLFVTAFASQAVGMQLSPLVDEDASEKTDPDVLSAKHFGMTLEEFQALDPLDRQVIRECTLRNRNDPAGPLGFSPLDDKTMLRDLHVERISGLPRIESVWLPYAFTDRSLKGLQSAKWLRGLGVRDCDDMSDAAIRELLTYLPNLESLTIHPRAFDSQVSNSSMNPTQETMEVIGTLRHLESLSLQRIKCPHAGLTYLGGLTHLRELEIYSEFLDDVGLAVISKLPRLERLAVNGHFTPQSLGYIAKLQNLTHLEMFPGTSPLTVEDYEALTQLTKLESFETGSHFPVEAFKYIVLLPNIKSISVSTSIRIPDRWVVELLKLPSLRTLEASVSPEMFAVMRKELASRN